MTRHSYTIPKRDEFDKADKRFMLERSKGLCEAEGPDYGWPKGHRCNAQLAYGVQFDHYNPTGAGGKGKGHPENGRAVCPQCHRFKTVKDQHTVAKVKRVSDKHHGITKPKGTIRSRGFGAWEDNTKHLEEL